MKLCIEKRVLTSSPKIQKDIKLENLLLNHTKMFDTTKEALIDGYVPLEFATTIRTAYSNLVLEFPNSARYYKSSECTINLPHKGYDLVMFLSSRVIANICFSHTVLAEVMMQSKFDIIGLFNTNCNTHSPIVYSQIILEDSTVERFKDTLIADNKFVPISDMEYTQFAHEELLNEIIEVKEEKTNE